MFSEGFEYTIFYYRYPYFEGGNIKSIGHRPPNKKIDNHNFGTYNVIERNQLISLKLIELFDSISHSIKGGWYIGRIDLKSENQQTLQNGEKIGIFELSQGGVIGDVDEKRDLATFHGLISNIRTKFLQIYIGYVNFMMGNVKLSNVISQVVIHNVAFSQICKNHEQYLGTFR